jgi:hypothetical protein
MTGVLNALVAGGGLGQYSVTLANDGSVTGYSSLGLGSISPSNSFLGNTLTRIFGTNTLDNFLVRVGSATTQSLFSSVLVQKHDGTWISLTSASATFSGSNQWEWTLSGGGVNTIWPTTADGTVRRVIFR